MDHWETHRQKPAVFFVAKNEYMEGSENRCSAGIWQAVSQSGAYVQYSRLLSVLSQEGMSSVSSGVTEAQKYKDVAEQAHWSCPQLLLYAAKEKLHPIKLTLVLTILVG